MHCFFLEFFVYCYLHYLFLLNEIFFHFRIRVARPYLSLVHSLLHSANKLLTNNISRYVPFASLCDYPRAILRHGNINPSFLSTVIRARRQKLRTIFRTGRKILSGAQFSVPGKLSQLLSRVELLRFHLPGVIGARVSLFIFFPSRILGDKLWISFTFFTSRACRAALCRARCCYAFWTFANKYGCLV